MAEQVPLVNYLALGEDPHLVAPREEAANQVARTAGLALAGFMTLPPLPASPEDSRPHFRHLRQLLDEVAEHHPEAVELSMGMSLDYEVAIEEGATMVRIGTALFGPRPPTGTGRM